MLTYIARRLIIFIPLILLISIITFFLIQLPPGNYLDTYVFRLQEAGLDVDEAEIVRLREQYGLDRPVYVQYFRWMSGLIRGDLGRSLTMENRLVVDILRERVPASMAISLATLVFVWVVAVPIGIYSATHQYSVTDYIATFVGFFGLAVPNFLFALVLIWLVYTQTGMAITGLFSVQFADAPWSFARFLDLLKRIWVPLIVLGTAGTAGLIRVMRGNLLDELKKQYVVTARSKGLKETRLLFKYPVRIALNPMVSTIGWLLPSLVSGEVIVSIVLDLKTVGPVLFGAITSQDMYLAGSVLMILSVLSIIGTLLSDILLAWIDPRIRYEKKAA